MGLAAKNAKDAKKGIEYTIYRKPLAGLHFVFVELPKFKAKNLTETKMPVLWLRFLTEIDESTKKAATALRDNPQTGQALEIVRESAYSKEEMAAYDGFWDYVSRRKEEIAEAEYAVRTRDAALAERDAEKTRADAATEKLRQTARNLKAMNLTIEQIAAATGLTADEIKAL